MRVQGGKKISLQDDEWINSLIVNDTMSSVDFRINVSLLLMDLG